MLAFFLLFIQARDLSQVSIHHSQQFTFLIDDKKNIAKLMAADQNFLIPHNHLVSIPDTIKNAVITSINHFAFRNFRNIFKIKLPTYLETIGDGAFENCEELSTISLPQHLKHIGSYAFSGCTFLVNITFPNGLESIGDYAFKHCSLQENVYLPSSVVKIGIGSFAYSHHVEKFHIVQNLHYRSFNGLLLFNNHELIQFPAGYKKDTFTIPDRITLIANNSFTGTKYLKSIKIPKSGVHFSYSSFENSSITTIRMSNCDSVDQKIIQTIIYPEFCNSHNLIILDNNTNETTQTQTIMNPEPENVPKSNQISLILSALALVVATIVVILIIRVRKQTLNRLRVSRIVDNGVTPEAAAIDNNEEQNMDSTNDRDCEDQTNDVSASRLKDEESCRPVFDQVNDISPLRMNDSKENPYSNINSESIY